MERERKTETEKEKKTEMERERKTVTEKERRTEMERETEPETGTLRCHVICTLGVWACLPTVCPRCAQCSVPRRAVLTGQHVKQTI